MKVSALGVEEQRVNVVIDLAEPSPAARALGDGYRVEVRVVVWREDDVVKVPVGSLFRPATSARGTSSDGEGGPDSAWAVFVVEAGRVRMQTVELGQRNNEEGQILSGAQAGQTIVLHPPDTLSDGTRISERRE
jgi:HlyD family secretion protein